MRKFIKRFTTGFEDAAEERQSMRKAYINMYDDLLGRFKILQHEVHMLKVLPKFSFGDKVIFNDQEYVILKNVGYELKSWDTRKHEYRYSIRCLKDETENIVFESELEGK